MKVSKIFQGDRVVWTIYFFLCIISLVEVFSAASTLSYRSGSFWSPLIKQALFLGIGTLVVIAVHNIPCRFFKIIPLFFLPVCIFLLLVTSLFGGAVNGGARWLSLGFIKFQPSELAKGVVITAVALVLAKMQRAEGADKRAFKYILWITGIICALILTENLSTAAILFGVVFLMMFIGRVPLLQLGKLLGVIFGVVLFAAIVVAVSPEDSAVFNLPGMHRALTWKHRVSGHVGEASSDSNDFDMANNAQVGHARIAIASSNIVGKAPGNSVQRDFLSQAFSDFIFAIIVEEMGIEGAIFVVFLYVVLLIRSGRIASRCERNFPAFLAMGLALLLVCQAAINMMVATGLFPVTGQPLPLISRGGTSTIITCVYIGMILSVSRYSIKTKEQNDPFAKGAQPLKRAAAATAHARRQAAAPAAPAEDVEIENIPYHVEPDAPDEPLDDLVSAEAASLAHK